MTLGRKGEEWRRERQSAEQCPLPLHRLHGGSTKRDRITASPVETAGMVQSNIQHCAQRILRELDTGDICVAWGGGGRGGQARRDRVADAKKNEKEKKRWTSSCSLVAGPKEPHPRPPDTPRPHEIPTS